MTDSSPKQIALIAHDAQKDDLLTFVREHIEFFKRHPLVATGNTGKLLGDVLGIEVERVTHGPHGGDLIIGGRAAQGSIAAVFFLRDPLTSQPHDPDVSALMRVCDVHQVPLATNIGTAQAIVESLESDASSENESPA